MEEIEVGAIYQHYKGQEYIIVGLAHHSETLEEIVVYKALYNSPDFGENAIWVRPKVIFLEYVIINSEKVPRFKKIN